MNTNIDDMGINMEPNNKTYKNCGWPIATMGRFRNMYTNTMEPMEHKIVTATPTIHIHNTHAGVSRIEFSWKSSILPLALPPVESVLFSDDGMRH